MDFQFSIFSRFYRNCTGRYWMSLITFSSAFANPKKKIIWNIFSNNMIKNKDVSRISNQWFLCIEPYFPSKNRARKMKVQLKGKFIISWKWIVEKRSEISLILLAERTKCCLIINDELEHLKFFNFTWRGYQSLHRMRIFAWNSLWNLSIWKSCLKLNCDWVLPLMAFLMFPVIYEQYVPNHKDLSNYQPTRKTSNRSIRNRKVAENPVEFSP